jgi:hypothetical protein
MQSIIKEIILTNIIRYEKKQYWNYDLTLCKIVAYSDIKNKSALIKNQSEEICKYLIEKDMFAICDIKNPTKYLVGTLLNVADNIYFASKDMKHAFYTSKGTNMTLNLKIYNIIIDISSYQNTINIFNKSNDLKIKLAKYSPKITKYIENPQDDLIIKYACKYDMSFIKKLKNWDDNISLYLLSENIHFCSYFKYLTNDVISYIIKTGHRELIPLNIVNDEEIIIKILDFNPEKFKELSKSQQTNNILSFMIKKSPYYLKETELDDMNLRMVRYNGLAIQYIKNKTLDLCVAAYNQNPESCKYFDIKKFICLSG